MDEIYCGALNEFEKYCFKIRVYGEIVEKKINSQDDLYIIYIVMSYEIEFSIKENVNNFKYIMYVRK